MCYSVVTLLLSPFFPPLLPPDRWQFVFHLIIHPLSKTLPSPLLFLLFLLLPIPLPPPQHPETVKDIIFLLLLHLLFSPPISPLALPWFSLFSSSSSSSSALQWNKRLRADESLCSVMAVIHHWDCTREREGGRETWRVRRREREVCGSWSRGWAESLGLCFFLYPFTLSFVLSLSLWTSLCEINGC